MLYLYLCEKLQWEFSIVQRLVRSFKDWKQTITNVTTYVWLEGTFKLICLVDTNYIYSNAFLEPVYRPFTLVSEILDTYCHLLPLIATYCHFLPLILGLNISAIYGYVMLKGMLYHCMLVHLDMTQTPLSLVWQ